MVANPSNMSMTTRYKTTACKIAVILRANNDNQADWFSAVKSYAREKGGLSLLMNKWNQSRSFNAEDLNRPTGLDATYKSNTEKMKEEQLKGEDGKKPTNGKEAATTVPDAAVQIMKQDKKYSQDVLS